MGGKYAKIFEPLLLNNGYAKNRIWVAPMGAALYSPEGYVTQQIIDRYAARAKGGAGTVTVGSTSVDHEFGSAHGGTSKITGSHAAKGWADIADRIHYYGARASIELYHAGMWADVQVIGGKHPIAPSALIREDGVIVDEITEEQMHVVADRFAEACQFFAKCGFDSVMIHAAHGWLLSAFLSPLDNKRTDQYGGSLENRARFPIMVLDRIREAVGDSLAIEYRLSATEGTEGGTTIEDSIAFLKMIEDKIDVVHQSFGTRRDSTTRERSNASQFFDYGFNLKYAKALKDGGVKTPVVAVASMDNPDLLEQALEKGWIDGAAIGKGIIADPQFPNKIREDRVEDIVPCLKCMHCFIFSRDNKDRVQRNTNFTTGRVHCSVNPNYGRESYPPIEPAKKKKRVVIAGGGPAGLNAAITAADRGHEVIVIEKTDHLGGIINYADYVDFKRFVKKYRDYLLRQIEKKNVKVLYRTEATREVIASYQPDAVIIAFGGKQRARQIQGSDGKNVADVREIYGKEESLGKKVAIIGGNESGVEAAIHLLNKGKEVAIIASRERIVPYTDYTARLPLIDRVEGKADIYVNSRATVITENSVTIRNKEDGSEKVIEADTVVFAIGSENQLEKALEYSDLANEFYVIGDAKNVADLENASKTGYDAAIHI